MSVVVVVDIDDVHAVVDVAYGIGCVEVDRGSGSWEAGVWVIATDDVVGMISMIARIGIVDVIDITDSATVEVTDGDAAVVVVRMVGMAERREGTAVEAATAGLQMGERGGEAKEMEEGSVAMRG